MLIFETPLVNITSTYYPTGTTQSCCTGVSITTSMPLFETTGESMESDTLSKGEVAGVVIVVIAIVVFVSAILIVVVARRRLEKVGIEMLR